MIQISFSPCWLFSLSAWTFPRGRLQIRWCVWPRWSWDSWLREHWLPGLPRCSPTCLWWGLTRRWALQTNIMPVLSLINWSSIKVCNKQIQIIINCWNEYRLSKQICNWYIFKWIIIRNSVTLSAACIDVVAYYTYITVEIVCVPVLVMQSLSFLRPHIIRFSLIWYM